MGVTVTHSNPSREWWRKLGRFQTKIGLGTIGIVTLLSFHLNSCLPIANWFTQCCNKLWISNDNVDRNWQYSWSVSSHTSKLVFAKHSSWVIVGLFTFFELQGGKPIEFAMMAWVSEPKSRRVINHMVFRSKCNQIIFKTIGIFTLKLIGNFVS